MTREPVLSQPTRLPCLRLRRGSGDQLCASISFAQSATDQRFVFVLLREAMDGLHAVVPYGDPAYASARGQLAYDRSVLTPLDSTFALAPGLSPLAPAFLEGELLPVQGLAIPYRTRSHFDAQSILETGLDKPVGTATGWLNRTLGVIGGASGAGIAVGGGLPTSLRGEVPVATWAPKVQRDGDEAFLADLSRLYNQDPQLADSFTAALNLQEQAMVMDSGGGKRGLALFDQLFSATGAFPRSRRRSPDHRHGVLRLGHPRGAGQGGRCTRPPARRRWPMLLLTFKATLSPEVWSNCGAGLNRVRPDGGHQRHRRCRSWHGRRSAAVRRCGTRGSR